jgi:hypothetical protein
MKRIGAGEIEDRSRTVPPDPAMGSWTGRPIGFLTTANYATGLAVSNDERKLVNYLANLIKESHTDQGKDFNVSLDVNISFKRTSVADAAAVIISNSPDAIKVALSEEDIRQKYPWDAEELRKRMKGRYSDFIANAKYYKLRGKLAATNPQFKMTRYLDPGNPKSSQKDFNNPNILQQFDQEYTLRKPDATA